MSDSRSKTDLFRALLTIAATVGTIAVNYMAATGKFGGVSVETISNRYPTLITPSGFAFTIWNLIYLGLLVFSIYQIAGNNLSRFRSIRSLYILSCALNCAWIFFWVQERIDISFVIISALFIVLFLIILRVRSHKNYAEYWSVKSPFGLYFGWITAAAVVNLAVLLSSLGHPISVLTGSLFILAAAAMGVLIRAKFGNYLYPLAIAWAATGIAVKQSGNTWIVVASAAAVVACLIASLSFITKLPTRAEQLETRNQPNL